MNGDSGRFTGVLPESYAGVLLQSPDMLSSASVGLSGVAKRRVKLTKARGMQSTLTELILPAQLSQLIIKKNGSNNNNGAIYIYIYV